MTGATCPELDFAPAKAMMKPGMRQYRPSLAANRDPATVKYMDFSGVCIIGEQSAVDLTMELLGAKGTRFRSYNLCLARRVRVNVYRAQLVVRVCPWAELLLH